MARLFLSFSLVLCGFFLIFPVSRSLVFSGFSSEEIVLCPAVDSVCLWEGEVREPLTLPF